MLGGGLALGLVSASKAWEMLPVKPRWLCASAPANARIASTISASSAAPARRRSAGDGARRPVAKPIAISDERQQEDHREDQRAELVARRGAFGRAARFRS